MRWPLGLWPTRRGAAVATVAALALAVGALTSARSLNAVVVPALVALFAGGAQLVRADPPSVERSTPAPGFPGERRTVAVTVDSEVPCRVTDAVGRGLSSEGETTGTVGHGGSFEYAVELTGRGDHDLGPATCRLTDSLGLFATEHRAAGTGAALVYPDVYGMDGAVLSPLVRRVRGEEQASFDRLREFASGDTMRDIHWRASAKRQADEFVVAEYESYGEMDAVAVVGEAPPDGADEMAATVASVAAFFHDAGVPVTIVVPDGQCVAPPGEMRPLLRLLAVTDAGRLEADRRAGADVYVRGEDGAATVSMEDREVAFGGVAGERRGREVVA